MVMNLGYTNDQRAVEPLIQALQDDDESMRRGAAESLGKLGDPRAVQPLIAALHDKDEFVRDAAAEALERIEGQKGSGGKPS
jgi:HEAT repeat protein